MATLTVGPGSSYGTIAAAVAAARDGDTVAVAAGTYVNDVFTIRKKIGLVASGGQVTLLGTAPLASGGALITVAADATISGFVVSGAHASDNSASGILVQSASLTLSNSLVTGNDTGLSATAFSTGAILIQSSEFARNGAGDGFSHNIAVGAVASLTIQDSYVHDARGGAEVRSLAAATTVTNSRIQDNAGAATVGLDLPNGGTVAIRGSTIEAGSSATGPAIRFGGGTVANGSSLLVSGNTLVADRSGALLLQNRTAITASLQANTLYGFTTVASGPASQSGNVVASVRPAISGAPVVAPASVLPVEFGRTGAVVANGVVRTVGSGGGYTSLAAAVAAANDGDTINLLPGSYGITPLTITHKLIIQGYGGLAYLTQAGTAPASGAGLLTTTTDVTLRSLDISGVTAPGGVAAAVYASGGNLVVVNSDLHGNQAGLLADGGSGATVGVYDSEIAANGLADGRGGNIQASSIGTLTLRNDWVHDAVNGPEVLSTAVNTVIDGTRISQMAGSGTADVALPNGGRVTIGSSALEKGAKSQAGPLVQVGGGTLAAGTTVSISGTTLIDDQPGSAPFVNAAGGAVAVSGSNFVGTTASSLVTGGSYTASTTSAGGVRVSTAAPWAAMITPAPGPLTMTVTSSTAQPGFGALVVRVSEDAFQGDAKFNLFVDGAAVGGTLTATASHAAGKTQTVTVAGTFDTGPHVVGVQYVNDRGARALYVDGVSFDGTETGGAATLAANGSALFTTAPVTRATAIKLSLSETASHGDALAFISIDGKLQGGPLSVTADHAAGNTQAMQFMLDLAPGAHTASVAFLNPAPGRGLFVDALDVAGTHIAGVGGAVAGSATYAFDVAPPPAANSNLFVTVGAPQDLVPVH